MNEIEIAYQNILASIETEEQEDINLDIVLNALKSRYKRNQMKLLPKNVRKYIVVLNAIEMYIALSITVLYVVKQ